LTPYPLWPVRGQFRIGLATRSDGKPADDWLGRVDAVANLKRAANTGDDTLYNYAFGVTG
jgi:hypothetical protein